MYMGVFGFGMARRPVIPDSVCREAEKVKEEYEYGSLGEAIRHMVREGDYDV